MTKSTHHLTLSACALAATLFLAACGGGASTDTVPPTVAITSAAGTGGAVTFSFVFSEDVGTSFTADDVAVTGGAKAATVTKVDATHYTLSVTPDAAATAVTATVAIGKFSDVANNTNTVAADSTFGLVPTTAPSTPPTRVASDVISIYGEAYTVLAGVNMRPDWGQSTTAVEQTVAGNKIEQYAALNYEGIEFPQVDVSAMTKLHIDVWTPNLATFKLSVISAGQENAVTLTPTLAGWNSYDLDMSSFTAADKTKVIQLKLDAQPASGTLYVDNIYFYKAASAPVSCGTTAPTCAPTTTIPAGAVTIYSEAATVAGFNARPDWGQSVTESEVTIAGNKSLMYGFQAGGFGAVGAYEGLDWAANPVDVSAKGKLHMDLWSADMTSMKISLISAGKENAYTQAITATGWNSVDIDLSNYTAADKTAIIQIKIESATAGTVYVDNIYFWGTATAGSAGTANPSAAMGSAGPVTIPVASAGDAFGFVATGDAVFAGDYVGPVDSLGHHALFPGATSTGAAANGNVGYFNDPLMDSSSQKLDVGGWISGSIDQPGIPNFFRYYVLTGPASTFANSYMGLFVNAPNNGVVNVSSYGSIKFKAWGPASMYEQANFNPTIEAILVGPKVTGCTTTGSGGTEISKTFIANLKIGAGSTYKLPLAGWTVKGVCGADTNSTAVASVLGALARVVVNVPASSFNFTNANTKANASDPTSYSTGINLGPIAFTNN